MNITRIGPGPLDPGALHEMVRMRDGVRLAADVYLPEGDGPFPTLLTRMPYDKTGVMTPTAQVARYLVAHGYAVVAQDVRGKFRSEGVGLNWTGEDQDGYDTIDWIVQQSWSNGAVGMWGNSYYGFTQIAAMTTQHPALRAISPRLTGTTLGQLEVSRPGQRTRPVNWTHHHLYALEFFHDNDNIFAELDWSQRPIGALFEAMRAEFGGVSPSFDQWYPHPRVRPRFRGVERAFDARAIPTLLTIGWWDNCAPYSWRDFETIQQIPRWKNALYLEIDSIDHYNHRLGAEYRLPPLSDEEWAERIPPIMDPTIRFFDVFLKNIAAPESIPRVHWAQANSGEAFVSDTWPPRGGEERVLFARGDRSLSAEPEREPCAAHWDHDPENLVPTTWEEAFTPLQQEPDETLDADHPGTLCFDTAPLDAPLDIVGKVTVRGDFASDGPQLDVFARLIEVDANGFGRRIASGNLHSDGSEIGFDEEIPLHYAGYRVRAGSRIRLVLASSCFPEWVPLPGTGEDPLRATGSAVNHQRVALGGKHGLEVRFTVQPDLVSD